MQALPPWDIVLFDAGRTLIQQHPGLAEAILSYSERSSLGLSPADAERAAEACRLWADERTTLELRGEPNLAHDRFLVGFYGAGLAAVFPGLAEPERARLAAELYAYTEQTRHWVAMPGARETLELLHSRGRRIGLVSNFSATLRGILDSQQLLELLDPVVISAEVGIEKPDPRILLLACERAGVSPDRAVYVGDHPFDVLCSKRAGLRVIWISDLLRRIPPELGVEPDRHVAVITQVPALLGLA